MEKNKALELTEDVQKDWLNVLRRLQSVAKTDGWAVLSIQILVDQSGCPKLWLSPKCRKIEPKLSASEILRLLTEDIAEEDGL